MELEEESIGCPYCGEIIAVLIDPGDIGQQYIEDCQVCCRPISFHISIDSMDQMSVSVSDENTS